MGNYQEVPKRITKVTYPVDTNNIQQNSTVQLKRKNIRSLCVGINYINTSYQLSGCVSDATNFGNYLKERSLGTNPQHLLLTDEEIELEGFVRRLPTPENLEKGLCWLLSGASAEEFDLEQDQYPPLPQDTLCVFYYAGHGGSILDLDGDENDHRDETLCPLTADGKIEQVSDDYIRELLVSRLGSIKNCTLLAITDCCHSGSNFDLKYVLKGNCFKNVVGNHKYVDTPIPVIHIAGCRDNQYSSENSSGGFLTTSLLKVLTSQHLSLYLLSIKLRTELAKLIPGAYQQATISSGSPLSAYNRLPL